MLDRSDEMVSPPRPSLISGWASFLPAPVLLMTFLFHFPPLQTFFWLVPSVKRRTSDVQLLDRSTPLDGVPVPTFVFIFRRLGDRSTLHQILIGFPHRFPLSLREVYLVR